MNDSVRSAYTEIVEDTTVLWDPDAKDSRAAVVVQLERDQWGEFHVDVALEQIDGAQLSFVLGVARRHELDVHEDRGWLRLGRHYNDSDDESADEPEREAVA